MKMWFNNKKKFENTQVVGEKAVGQELSEELMAQISGGLAANMSDCHPAQPTGPILTC